MKKAIPDYKITELCRLFTISMSRYYYSPVTPSLADIELMLLIKSISVQSGNTYGKLRVAVELNELGNNIGLYKTRTLMKHLNIKESGLRKGITIQMLVMNINMRLIY
jgi:hypothetical protein